jgi:hypothetical protein
VATATIRQRDLDRMCRLPPDACRLHDGNTFLQYRKHGRRLIGTRTARISAEDASGFGIAEEQLDSS